jgi:N-acyl homoserine lactone hydrolase
VALAEATRLTQPLPGGREGATVAFRPLNTAHMLGPLEPMAMSGGKLRAIRSMRGDRSGWNRYPIPVFLIEHPQVGYVLVDTGLHASVAVDPKQNLGPILGRLYTIEMKPEQTAAAQLRALGISSDDIKIVVMTHMHMDHTSAISDFTEATYVVGEGEWSAFSAPRSTFNGYVKKHAGVAVEFREVVYDTRVVSSYSTFGRAFDLFGDGSIRLVYTPGHSRGHQSIILRLKDREALLAGDAVYALATLEHERRGLFLDDEHTWRRSLRELQLYRRENPDALVIASHDHEVWPTLAERYE